MNLTATRQTRLDDDELLHLALHAMQGDRHEEAIDLLKRTIEAHPESARAHYLLGAEHARIGLYDRAVDEMAAAVRLDPRLAAARFQLGLLHLTSGRHQEAQSVWTPLDQLAANDPLRIFKSALSYLIRDERAQCIEALRHGIEVNKANQALNEDMRRLLADVEERWGDRDTNKNVSAHEPVTPAIQVPTPSKRMLLSVYDRNRDDGAADS
jgi:tetratricopeptide (TPR) repeat protein